VGGGLYAAQSNLLYYVAFSAENFRRHAAGEPVLNVVNLQRGY
jgi:hypothetical protein